MPKLKASQEDIKGEPPVPPGIYTVMLKGFKPKFSKKRDSVNLNPQIEVVNHADFNNRKLFDSLNTKAKWTWPPFFACFGVAVTPDANGDVEFPGDFNGPDNDPEKWSYVGPLQGQVGQVEVEEVAILDAVTKQPTTDARGNTTQNRIKRYIPAA
jgi:hypothetical protein